MNIHEFTRPVTSSKLNENLAKMYGQKLQLDKYTNEQLEDFRNRLRTRISQVETTESFDSVLKDTHQRERMFLELLNTAIEERHADSGTTISEGAEDSAEIVMAGKDMVERVTSWMEDTAEMQSQSMLDLADSIRDEMGAEKAEEFTNMVKPALDSMYAAMETTRQTLTGGVGILTGEGSDMGMMGGDEMEMEPTVDGDMDMDMDMDTDLGGIEGDDFDADMAASGGDEDMGREKRESVERRRTAKK
mgnify:CR=1 FL=1|jgi:hypothetical protein